MNANGQPKLTDAIQVLEQVALSIPFAEIPSLLGSLEKAKALSWSRMLAEQQRAQPETMGKAAMTAQDVAPILNVGASMVYELARTKRLKSYRVGKYIRFKEADVQEFLASGGA